MIHETNIGKVFDYNGYLHIKITNSFIYKNRRITIPNYKILTNFITIFKNFKSINWYAIKIKKIDYVKSPYELNIYDLYWTLKVLFNKIPYFFVNARIKYEWVCNYSQENFTYSTKKMKIKINETELSITYGQTDCANVILFVEEWINFMKHLTPLIEYTIKINNSEYQWEFYDIYLQIITANKITISSKNTNTKAYILHMD